MLLEVEDAIELGERLIQAKPSYPVGTFQDAVPLDFGISARQGQKCMTLARNQNLIKSKLHLSINELCAYIMAQQSGRRATIRRTCTEVNASIVEKLKAQRDVKPLNEHNLGATMTGVYLLMLGDNCVYVGQAKNIFHRLSNHQHDETKIFDNVLVELAPSRLLHIVEYTYIQQLKPRLNRTGL